MNALRVLACAIALSLAGAGEAAAQAKPAESYLDVFNRAMYDTNAFLGARLSAAATAAGLVPGQSPLADATARVVFNFVNEPVAVISHLATGDLDLAWTHAKRFAINSTLGYLGAVDEAAARGLPASAADFGLALCAYGVPAGPFVYIPVLGPRTLRDALSDIVIGNVVVIAALAPVLPLSAVVAVAVLDEAIVLAVSRGMDPFAASIAATSYDEAKALYLADRTRRCEAAAAGVRDFR